MVFPRAVDGERYVGEVVELLSASEYAGLDGRDDHRGEIRKDGHTVYWHRVARRTHDGGFEVAALDDVVFLDALAARTDRPTAAVHAEFERKRRYVEYLCRAGVDDFDALFRFCSNLRTDETATVERIRRRAEPPTPTPDRHRAESDR